jgi:hypothetical protein
MHLILALVYATLGSTVAALSLQGGAALGAQYLRLRILAAEQDRDVPPLVTVYFRNTARLMFVSALAYLAGTASDAITAQLSPSVFAARVLGYGSAVFLLITSSTLVFQAVADRKLGLHNPAWRIAYLASGFVGVPVAMAGMGLVAYLGSVWP